MIKEAIDSLQLPDARTIITGGVTVAAAVGALAPSANASMDQDPQRLTDCGTTAAYSFDGSRAALSTTQITHNVGMKAVFNCDRQIIRLTEVQGISGPTSDVNTMTASTSLDVIDSSLGFVSDQNAYTQQLKQLTCGWQAEQVVVRAEPDPMTYPNRAGEQIAQAVYTTPAAYVPCTTQPEQAPNTPITQMPPADTPRPQPSTPPVSELPASDNPDEVLAYYHAKIKGCMTEAKRSFKGSGFKYSGDGSRFVKELVRGRKLTAKCRPLIEDRNVRVQMLERSDSAKKFTPITKRKTVTRSKGSFKSSVVQRVPRYDCGEDRRMATTIKITGVDGSVSTSRAYLTRIAYSDC